MKVKLLISALLCLFLMGCSTPPIVSEPAHESSMHSETADPIVTNAPKITLSYTDLNNFTFIMDTEAGEIRISGDNMQGKRSQLYVRTKDFDGILELNTKGGSTMYYRKNQSEEYETSEIEYSEVDMQGLYDLLYFAGVDFGDRYEDARFTLTSEDNDFCTYKMDYDGNTYVITVDKETGVWTKMTCDGKTIMRMREFSVEKGIIPNH